MLQSRKVSNTCLLIGLSLGVTACPSEQQSSQSSPATVTSAQTSPTATNTNPAVVNRPAEFCQQIVNAKNFRVDITDELKVFCSGTAPTDNLLKLYNDAAAQDPGKQPTISLYETGIDDGDDGFSKVKLLFSFVAPAKVEQLKQKPLVESLAADYVSNKVKQTAKASKNATESLDATGLHFLSADITYDMTILSDAQSNLNNTRKAQFNVYQLSVSNEHLGIAIEHLLETNEDYRRATMVNLVLSTPGDTNSVIVTMLNYELANRGLHATAVSSIKEVAINAGNALYKALTQPN